MIYQTIKFSEFPDGTNITPGDIPVGLRDGLNYKYAYTTAQNPLIWEVINVSQTMEVGHGYIVNGAGVILTIPDTFAVGEKFGVALVSGDFTIQQQAAQEIIMGALTTTNGAVGTLASNNVGDVVELVAHVANTHLIVTNSMGNITVT